jgi:hypothetical protein
MALSNDIKVQGDNSIPVVSNVKSIFTYVTKRWYLFLIVAIIGGLAGILYSINKKTEYKSHLTFALDEGDNGNIGNIMNLASQFGFSFGSSKDLFSGDNILEIMKSRRMVEQVLLSVDTFNHKPYTFIEYYLLLSGKLKPKPGVKEIHFPAEQQRSTFTYQQDSLLYKIYREFALKYIVAQRPDRKLSIYEVSVTSPDEKFTKDFTDKIVAATNDFYVQIRTKKAKETLDILQQRVTSMKGNLNSSITDRASVQDVNINPAFAEAQVPVQKQQANIQVYGAAYGEMFKNLELARFQYLNEIPLMQIIDAANYPMEKVTSGKLKMAVLFALLAELLILGWIGLRSLFSTKQSFN